MNWLQDLVMIGLAAFLVLLNGFFVAAEFALVKVRPSRLDELARQGGLFARTARWLAQRMDASLSSCQLGITMASLGLGWIGEPAFARLIAPLLSLAGITRPALVHTIGFIIAFTLITALHLVIGEQAPKIYAIKKPERMLLWCAMPLKVFYLLSYPLLISLNSITTVLLRRVGLEDAGHDAPHSEDELRAVILHSQAHGVLSRTEHSLLDAVIEFDDIVCRKVMVPRIDVAYHDVNDPLSALLELIKRTQHTRYPVCDGSMDSVIGVIHVKDLIGVGPDDPFDVHAVMRPPRQVPESLSISRLLRHFQASHQLMALVVDEYGSVAGIVTLENVLEQIVGPVDDEFDTNEPEVVPDGQRRFIVSGGAACDLVWQELGLDLDPGDADTFSGYLVSLLGKLPQAGQSVELGPARAEILETQGGRATRVRVTLAEDASPE